MSSRYKHVFTPIRIRGVDFKNRVFLAPTTPTLSTPDGFVTNELVDWMRMFARGGVTTLTLGNCSVDVRESHDQSYQLDLGTDDCVYPLSLWADMCRHYGAHASLEINHAGEGTLMTTDVGFSSSSFISDDERIRAGFMGREPIATTEMSKEKIREVVEMFGRAAGRVKRAGMDICMVHGGHDNLISQFTSPKFNKRTDEYGGSTEKRARFAIEVCESIRRHCGDKFVIEYRCSGDEIAADGMHIEETIKLAGYLKPYIDILHVSAGLHNDPRASHEYYKYWCQNYMMEHCFNMHFARDIKAAHPDLLVNTVGSIMSLDYAEEIIGNGWADFVSMCRPLMADPEMPNKYAENRAEDRRPCLRCDMCARHLMVPKPMFCAVNPMANMTSILRDGEIPVAKTKKKVAVVGGGPGGIQAMETLLDRGHEVTLYEKSGSLGGSVIHAAAPSFKVDIRDYLAWMRRSAAKSAARGARILLNTEATKDVLDVENYDALVLAVGADPVIPNVPGIDLPHVHWAPEVDENPSLLGDKIVVVGGGGVGIEAVLSLTEQGRDVTLVEMLDEGFAKMSLGMSMGSASYDFPELFEERKVKSFYGSVLSEVRDGCIVLRDMKTKVTTEVPCDTVLLAIGVKERFEVVDCLRRSAPETSVHIVGDCREAGTISSAVNQAFQACLNI